MSDKKKNENYYLSYGISFGLIAGAGLGILFTALTNGSQNWMTFGIPVGAGLGMLCGMVIGMLMDAKNKKK